MIGRRMLEHKNKRLKFALFTVLFIAVYSVALWALWNWLMPTIFGLPAISFWQALGLLVLSRILFGGFAGRFRGGGRHGRFRMKEKLTHEDAGEQGNAK